MKWVKLFLHYTRRDFEQHHHLGNFGIQEVVVAVHDDVGLLDGPPGVEVGAPA